MKDKLKEVIIRNKWYVLGAAALILILIAVFTGRSGSEVEMAVCEQGLFETSVVTIGQIEATKTIDITIPDELRQRKIRIWGIKIIDMIAEGTKVQKGDYVASLDPTNVDNEIKENQDQLDQFINSYETACLDSTLKLTGYRNDITNAIDQLADKKIAVEQSIYESQAYQRQAQIAYETAQRNLEQKKRTLIKQRMKLEVDINRIKRDMEIYQERLDMLTNLKRNLKILAPSSGMVIYAKNAWTRNKMKVGDEVNMHQPNIAVLPDLSSLVSEAFVKEVEIKNVYVGQTVRIGIDAFPDIKFSGKILKVANIGQTIPGEQMNGFKVSVALDKYREELLPGMTTNNSIITGTWDDALMILRPAVFGSDSLRYVYHKTAFSVIKQQVITGGENETHFQILKGIERGDRILLKEPENALDLELVRCTP